MAFTNRPTITVQVGFTDPEGERSISKFNLSGIAPTSTLADIVGVAEMVASAVGLLSQATTDHITVTQYVGFDYSLPAESGNLDNIEDKAFIESVTADGQTVKWNIPCPNTSMFASDGETVDPTYANLASLIGDFATGFTSGAATGFLSTVDGVPVRTYVKGYLRRAKTRRRLRQGIAKEMGG